MLSPPVIWLAILVVVASIHAFRRMLKSEYDLWESTLYAPVYVIGRLLWRVSFRNEPPPEIKTGAILAANHRSSVDPFFVQLAAGRRVHWFVAKEYCQHFLFGAVLKPLQVIPTNRTGMDLHATKTAIQYARDGKLVGLFPEGKINVTQKTLLKIRAGAALVAVKTGMPVIPIYIEGSPYCHTVWSPLFMPARVVISFGTAIHPQPIDGEAGAAETRSAQLISQHLIEEWATQLLSLSNCGQDPTQLLHAPKRKS